MIKIARVINNESGYPVVDKEIDFFDNLTTGKGEDDPDQFTVVELEVAETTPGSGIPDLSMSDCFDWIDRQDHQDGIPQWHDNGMPVMDPHRIPKKKYDTKELKKDNHRRIPSALLNKANASALKEVVVADYEADFEKERAKYDTLANAILSVGTSKTFATIAAAFSASSSGDSVFIFATAAGFYAENPVVPHSLTVAGMIPDQGVIIQSSTGNVFTAATGTNIILNMTARGVGGTPTLGFFLTGVGGILGACIVFDVVFGLRIDIGTLCVNCLAYDCTDSGLFTTNNAARVLFVTAANNTKNGIRTGTGTSVDFCLSISNTTADYINGLGTSSMGNVSSDATQPGTGGVGTATTSVFTDFAAKDFSLDINNAITVFAVPGVATDITGALRKTTDTSNVLYPGAYDPDPPADTVPGKPLMGVLVPAAGQVTIPVIVANAGDEVFARTRIDTVEPWDAESPTFSRIGDGDIIYTGLTDVRREFGLYAKSGSLTSDWDTDFAIVGAAAVAATRPLAKYKVAIRDFFLNSTNLADWIQTVDAGGSTAGRVIMGYSARSTPPDIITKGPKVFISTNALAADNAGPATDYITTVKINAEIIWFMDHLDDAPFTVEENFIDLLLNEACGLGLTLDSTLEGSIESINVDDIELDDGTEGQGRRERRTVVEFLIVYPMPT